MYQWDPERDTFTPGQFVKGRASVLAISPNSKYVVYYAEAFSKRAEACVAISHLPYFTAHAYFLQFHLALRSATFHSESELELWTITRDDSSVEGRGLVEERIDPGCPFKIKRHKQIDRVLNRRLPEADTSWVRDESRGRRVLADGYDLVEYRKHDRRVIASFPKEEFQEVAPPDWAKQW